MQTEIEFKKGSGNIFKDLGLANPEERLTKANIASMIYDIIEQQELTQKEAGTILGVSQPKISALRARASFRKIVESSFLFDRHQI